MHWDSQASDMVGGRINMRARRAPIPLVRHVASTPIAAAASATVAAQHAQCVDKHAQDNPTIKCMKSVAF
eukprot:325803-Chlamydomonas_euryale.AAC.2